MSSTVMHPLEPLTQGEIEAAAEAIRGDPRWGETTRFVTLSLEEPDKADVRAADDGADFGPRRIKAILYDRGERKTYEVGVSLGGAATASVATWTHVPGVQPLQLEEEAALIEDSVRSDARWQEAVRARGIGDLSTVVLNPWCPGYLKPADGPDEHRLMMLLFSVRAQAGDNHYARPLEGLSVLVDTDTGEIVELEDSGPVPIPTHSGDYVPELAQAPDNWTRVTALREDVRPLEIRQPGGPSFRLDGYRLEWQKWSLRIGFGAREGLILHQMGYEDDGRVRSILDRASLSEMWVPYGDPGVTHYRKNVFDAGEGGFGLLANSLELGCDCIGEVRYLDGVVNDADGRALIKKHAVCIHEEDAGLAWKHTDESGAVEVRRMRRLVISSIYTIGNYEYGLYWRLYQDGSIECELKLTGIIATGAVPPGVEPLHGALIAPGLYGPHHQHFFSIRLDMAVDGPRNSVCEVDTHAVPPGNENPWGNAWRTSRTVLRSEHEAQRDVDTQLARYWRIENPNVLNDLGEPVAYKLVPGENVLPFHQDDAPALARAGFARHHLWVTRYARDELWAAGSYPYQHAGGAGLPLYVAQNRSVENEDVVVWYTCGSHHIVRPEDWPVMPVVRLGFALRPEGFFRANPALDLPRPNSCH